MMPGNLVKKGSASIGQPCFSPFCLIVFPAGYYTIVYHLCKKTHSSYQYDSLELFLFFPLYILKKNPTALFGLKHTPLSLFLHINRFLVWSAHLCI